MIPLSLLIACGLLDEPEPTFFGIEEPASEATHSWPNFQSVSIHDDWQLTKPPLQCQLQGGVEVMVHRKMRVFRETTTHVLPASRRVLGTLYGTATHYKLSELTAGKPLDQELPAGTQLTVYGKHPTGRGCLWRLPDQNVVSFACIDGVYLVAEPETTSEITCNGITGWLGKVQ